MDPRLRRCIIHCISELSRKRFTDFCEEFDYIVIDLPSIIYGLNRPETFIVNIGLAQQLGQSRARFILVLDYSQDKHRPLAERRLKVIRELGLDYVLSTDRPAEIKAAEIVSDLRKKGYSAVVLSRDYDPLLIVDDMLQPVGAKFTWIVRYIKVDRECLIAKCKSRLCDSSLCQG